MIAPLVWIKFRGRIICAFKHCVNKATSTDRLLLNIQTRTGNLTPRKPYASKHAGDMSKSAIACKPGSGSILALFFFVVNVSNVWLLFGDVVDELNKLTDRPIKIL